MGVFLATIDGSIVNIALPNLVNDLKEPLAVVQWVVLAYLLTLTTLMLSVGRLADMIGRKRLYLAGMFIFTTGSLLCGISPNVYWLIGFRVFQAIGAAMTQALGTAIVTDAFPAEERVGDLHQDARAIPGFRVAAARAPVLQVHEYLNSFEDDIVRPFSLDVCDETYAAGIPFKTRVVQTMAGRVSAAIAPLFHQSHTFPRGGTFHVALLAPE